MGDVPPGVVEKLNRGERETRELVEAFTIDFAVLMRHAGLPAPALKRMRGGASLSYTKRMRLAGELGLEHLGEPGIAALASHASDTVRGWACYMAGLAPGWSLGRRIACVRPLADDPHFGVREWAWLGIRESIAHEPAASVRVLEPWTREPSAYLRRFATEATRPRGVWARHIGLFKEDPAMGLPLLEPLRADPERYVQDSVANWLNDAAKTRAEWVRDLCRGWLAGSDCPATARICARATRSLPAS
ncbi:MAG: DNA alkylation repair protein [Phycisphaeraceae bacterium]|nr:MAG: DNA alkylation repair protein [Phycisphaeraceae bacterium]